MEKKAVIFDLDGTLLDTLEDLADSCNKALSDNGLETYSLDQIKSFVGNGLGVLIEKTVPDGKNNPLYEKVLKDMQEIYSKNWRNKTKTYCGIENLLSELRSRKMKLGIVSNKPDPRVKDIAGIYFQGFVSPDCAVGEMENLGIKRKPAPDSVFHVLDVLGVKKEDSIYVGDSDVDIMTAENAGMDCISVTWGFRTRDFLIEHGGHLLVDSPQEILDLLDETP